MDRPTNTLNLPYYDSFRKSGRVPSIVGGPYSMTTVEVITTKGRYRKPRDKKVHNKRKRGTLTE